MGYLRTGTVLFHYGLATACFGHVLHADLFSKGDRIASTPPAECLSKLLELAAAPRNKTVAVEFHDYSIRGLTLTLTLSLPLTLTLWTSDPDTKVRASFGRPRRSGSVSWRCMPG